MRSSSPIISRDAAVALAAGATVFAGAAWAYGSGFAASLAAELTGAVETEVMLFLVPLILLVLGIAVEAVRLVAHGALPEEHVQQASVPLEWEQGSSGADTRVLG